MSIAGIGIFTLPEFINPKTGILTGLFQILIAISAGTLFNFITTYLLYKEENIQEVLCKEKWSSFNNFKTLFSQKEAYY
ncbi:MAG: hypothetical protein ACK5LM_04065 [Lactovum sp.]